VAELQFALIQRAQLARAEALSEAQSTVRYLEKKLARGAAELARLRAEILAEARRRGRRKPSR
jgi:multidrug resistance efflux pump